MPRFHHSWQWRSAEDDLWEVLDNLEPEPPDVDDVDRWFMLGRYDDVPGMSATEHNWHPECA